MANQIRNPWLIVEGEGDKDQIIRLECLRCGTFHPIALPMNTRAFLKLARSFLVLHADCQMKVTPTKVPPTGNIPRGDGLLQGDSR